MDYKCQSCGKRDRSFEKENLKLKKIIQDMRSWLASVPASWSTIPANADLMLGERNINNDNNIDGEEVFNQDCEQDDCENIEKDPDPIGQNHEITGLDHAIFGLIGNANALNAAGDICDPLFEESNDEYVHATASSDAEPARKKRRSAAVDYLENVRSDEGLVFVSNIKEEEPPEAFEYEEDFVMEGSNHKCDECDHVAKSKFNLNQHKQARHGSRSFFCPECDYTATTMKYLKDHIESIHMEKKYKCDLCDFFASLPRLLRKHVKAVHGDVIECDECDYTTRRQSNLNQHKRKKHSTGSLVTSGQ